MPKGMAASVPTNIPIKIANDNDDKDQEGKSVINDPVTAGGEKRQDRSNHRSD
jgi:hypothetical protein